MSRSRKVLAKQVIGYENYVEALLIQLGTKGDDLLFSQYLTNRFKHDSIGDLSATQLKTLAVDLEGVVDGTKVLRYMPDGMMVIT
jgi:hypothetical protein